MLTRINNGHPIKHILHKNMEYDNAIIVITIPNIANCFALYYIIYTNCEKYTTPLYA